MAWWKKRKTQQSAPVCVGAFTDVGRVRDENEDAFGQFPEEAEGDQLFIVADGMGGHTRGREASTTTVEMVKQAYFDGRRGSVPDRLTRAFQRANRQVYEMARAVDGPGSMGTTGTALAMVNGNAYIAHVGDSRAYRFHPDGFQLLTKDHTMVEAMRREGLLTAEEARTHPRRGTLTRAIGVDPEVEVDTIELGAPRADDRFLLCSDGLAEIPDDELQEVVLNRTPQEACEELIDRANERGGYDNATALVICIKKP